jgi:DNA-binding NtrC family response regulator
LQGIPIQLPPLRERIEDIVKLAMFFLTNFKKTNEITAKQISPEAVDMLEKYTWPGNIRELKNIVERTAIFCDSEIIEPEHLPKELRASSRDINEFKIPATWEEFKKFKHFIQSEAVNKIEKRFILEALKKAEGNISKAAKIVGMQRTNFHSMLQKYKLTKE